MVAPAFCRDPHIQTARSLALRCKVAMTTIEVVPSLEELSLVDVRGQQCMPGVETNLGELLLTAAETTPDNVCLEVEAESYTFAQVRQQTRVLSTFKHEFREPFVCQFQCELRTLIPYTFPKVNAVFVNLSSKIFVLQHGLLPDSHTDP